MAKNIRSEKIDFRAIDQVAGNYYYNAVSETQDTLDDTRYYNSSGWIYEETCTVANATKGAGTWIKTKGKRTISLTDSNMAEGAGSYINLVTSKSGTCTVFAGDNQEWARFNFTTAAVVSLIDGSLNVASTSTDACLVIRDAGTNVRIINELGATRIFTIIVNYNV